MCGSIFSPEPQSRLDARSNEHLRLEAIKLAVQIKDGITDTSVVIRAAHGIYDFIKTGNKKVTTEHD